MNEQNPRNDSMKSRALRAGGWTAVGFGAGQGLRLISTLVMTRLLAPEMFGLMAIALTVNVVVALLTDLGIKQNIVQRRLVQIELGSQLVSPVAMVGVGTLTHSIWALVLGQWLGAIVSTVLSHTALPGHRDWFAWDEEALREILRFGRWVFVSSF